MSKISHYFGFDLGDGESAVAWLREGSSAPPMMIEIAGRKNVLSVLGETEDHQYVIGEQALVLSPHELHARFKSRFLRERSRSAKCIRAYAACVLREIEKTSKLQNPSESAFFVGCPSGWSEDDREAYRQLFEEAGLPNVTIISESRAAFLFARESGELGLPDQALSRPALVIDAGSSTTDFTFIEALEAKQAFDFGENALGGGLIDQLLLERNVARHDRAARIGQIFDECPQYQARAELEARKVKEMYFTRRMQKGASDFALPCESSVKLYCDAPPITLDISCTDQDMAAILDQQLPSLGGRSYLATYESGLLQAKRALIKTPPELIMLTGGASRMDFVSDVARRVFPSARIVTGAEPEFAIARGLCYALRMDTRAETFIADVRALIESDKVETIVASALPGLMRQIAPVLADELTTRVAPDAFAAWKNGTLKTIADMTGAMGDLLKDNLERGALRQSIAEITRGWIESVRPLLESETDPICARCHLPPASLRLPGAAPGSVAEIDLNHIDFMDLRFLQTLVDIVVGSLIAMVLGGGGVAILLSGPVGFIVSFVIGFVISRFGTTLMRKNIDKFNMPAFMRALFSKRLFEKSIAEKRGEIELSIQKQLDDMLAKPDPSIETLIHEVSCAIEKQLTDMASGARLMIH